MELCKSKLPCSMELETGCEIFKGYTRSDGYGSKWFRGKNDYAHRVSWVLSFGEIPKDKIVCHACDNPSCINPEHLFLGTQKENIEDMYKKKRGPDLRGENNSQSRLKKSDVIFIKLFGGIISRSRLAEMFGVGLSTIQDILKERTWRHV